MKICPKCKKQKKVSAFYKNRNASDGLDHYCRDCTKKRMKEYFRTEQGKAASRRAQRKYLSKKSPK